jgi:hypothetical protein
MGSRALYKKANSTVGNYGLTSHFNTSNLGGLAVRTHTENPSDFRFLEPNKAGASGGVVFPYRKHLFAVWR